MPFSPDSVVPLRPPTGARYAELADEAWVDGDLELAVRMVEMAYAAFDAQGITATIRSDRTSLRD